MRTSLAASTRWTWGAATLSLAAAGFLAWQLTRDDQPPLPPPSTIADAGKPGATADAPDQPFELAPAEEYADVLDRPLFIRSRRPPSAEAANGAGSGGAGGGAAGEEVAASNLALSGVVLSSGRRVALVRLDNDPKIMHVAEGQEAGGWLFEKIRPDKVVLRRGETTGEIILDYKRRQEGAPPGSPAIRARAPAPAKEVPQGDDEENPD